jgi:hypothetical protein
MKNVIYFVASKVTKEFPMKKLHAVVALAIFSTSLMGSALAQEHRDNHAYVEHREWRKGAPIRHEDWDRAEVVDYRHGVTSGA